MAFYSKFIGTIDWPYEIQYLTQIYGIIRFAIVFAISLTQTFFYLYIFDSIGFGEGSIIITVILIVQLSTDYPTGSLGDQIGHKWVLASSMFLSFVSFLLLSFVTTFVGFIIMAIFNGLAAGQFSGALQSWFDNNFKEHYGDKDPEQREYGYSMNRLNAASNFIAGITIIVGGILATLLGRNKVFILDSFVYLILIFVIIKFMNNPRSSKLSNSSIAKDKNNFLDNIKGGFKFVFSNHSITFFVLGAALFEFFWELWASLIIFPLYFGYTGSDGGAGFLRSFLFFIGVAITIVISGMIKRINKHKLNLFQGLNIVVLLGGISLLLILVPMQNEFSWIGVITITIVFLFSSNFLSKIGEILYQRVVLDLFPSEFRNSLYSLIPTLTGIVAIPFLPLAGSKIESNGLIAGIGVGAIFAFTGLILMEIGIRGLYRKKDLFQKNES